MKPCLSVDPRKIKSRDPDDVIGVTIGASLRSISNIKNKELAKVKISEIIFKAQFGNPMAPFSPNQMKQTLPITFPTDVQTHDKETCLIRIFHLHEQIS